MIKINLALKKQPNLASDSKGREKVGGGLPKIELNMGALKALLQEPKIRQAVLGAIVLVGAFYYLENLKEDEIKKVDGEISVLSTEAGKLKAEVAKTKGYEEIKKSLETDELAIRNKIDTIQKLVADRQVLPKMMQGMAQLIPNEVWLTDFKVTNEDFTLKGYSLGYNQVSDFMRNLNDSAFFTELRLSSSQAARDETGSEVAQFELGARKRQ